MDVYKIVLSVCALAIVTLLSVIAEMLSKAQETRAGSLASYTDSARKVQHGQEGE